MFAPLSLRGGAFFGVDHSLAGFPQKRNKEARDEDLLTNLKVRNRTFAQIAAYGNSVAEPPLKLKVMVADVSQKIQAVLNAVNDAQSTLNSDQLMFNPNRLNLSKISETWNELVRSVNPYLTGPNMSLLSDGDTNQLKQMISSQLLAPLNQLQSQIMLKLNGKALGSYVINNDILFGDGAISIINQIEDGWYLPVKYGAQSVGIDMSLKSAPPSLNTTADTTGADTTGQEASTDAPATSPPVGLPAGRQQRSSSAGPALDRTASSPVAPRTALGTPSLQQRSPGAAAAPSTRGSPGQAVSPQVSSPATPIQSASPSVSRQSTPASGTSYKSASSSILSINLSPNTFSPQQSSAPTSALDPSVKQELLQSYSNKFDDYVRQTIDSFKPLERLVGALPSPQKQVVKKNTTDVLAVIQAARQSTLDTINQLSTDAEVDQFLEHWTQSQYPLYQKDFTLNAQGVFDNIQQLISESSGNLPQTPPPKDPPAAESFIPAALQQYQAAQAKAAQQKYLLVDGKLSNGKDFKNKSLETIKGMLSDSSLTALRLEDLKALLKNMNARVSPANQVSVKGNKAALTDNLAEILFSSYSKFPDLLGSGRSGAGSSGGRKSGKTDYSGPMETIMEEPKTPRPRSVGSARPRPRKLPKESYEGFDDMANEGFGMYGRAAPLQQKTELMMTENAHMPILSGNKGLPKIYGMEKKLAKAGFYKPKF